MSDAALPSDDVHAAAATALAPVRARGGVSIKFKAGHDGRTRLADLHERGGFRAKLPRTHGLTEAVLINTGGGLLGGDAVRFDVEVEPGAAAQVTTQSAERVYRSLGTDCAVDVALTVAAGGRLHWLPQETILFNQAQLTRTISVKMADDATLVLVEATVFGRAAMNERVLAGSLHDAWRIRRGGQLIYADAVKLSGDVSQQLSRAAIGANATAMATVLYIAADAADRVEGARAALSPLSARAAVSAWNGMLVGRLLAPSADALKADVARLVAYLSGHDLPRVWGLDMVRSAPARMDA
jgi:urease accessory protein